MAARVRIVVLNFNGGDLTRHCLDSISTLEWPRESLDVVVVDNASADKSAQRAVEVHPWARLIISDRNRGFAGGNNLALRDLGDCEYVGLLNNDATVDSGWLASLVGGLESDPGYGAACPKIHFSGLYHEVCLAASPNIRGRGDNRELGVQLSGIEVDGKDRWADSQFADGWWGFEAAGNGRACQWSRPSARLLVPAGGVVRLRLAAERSKLVQLGCGGEATRITIGSDPRWHEMAPAGSGFLVLNNVGNQLLPGGYGADRGLCERSAGRYDEPVDVFAWCGASVLLRRGYLEDAGLLDERLFLYYEDLDLSWRGLARGWRYRYTPGAIAYHRHSATSIEGSAISTYYIERNRLLVLAKNAPAGLAARAIVRHPLITASYTRRDVISPLLYLRSPRTLIPIRRMRAFLGFLYRLPATLVDRWRLGRRGRLSARRLAAWIESSEVSSSG